MEKRAPKMEKKNTRHGEKKALRKDEKVAPENFPQIGYGPPEMKKIKNSLHYVTIEDKKSNR